MLSKSWLKLLLRVCLIYLDRLQRNFHFLFVTAENREKLLNYCPYFSLKKAFESGPTIVYRSTTFVNDVFGKVFNTENR